MRETKLELSPTCAFILYEYDETFPTSLALEYVERSPVYHYSDTETSIEITKEQAGQIVLLLQKFIREE